MPPIRILAPRATMSAVSGAPEPATTYRMHGSLSGAYGVRHVGARNRIALTNTVPSGFRSGSE